MNMKKAMIYIWMIACILVGVAIGLSLQNKRAYYNGINRASDCTNSGGVIMILQDGDSCVYSD